MEQQHAPYITQALALAWAQQPVAAQPAYWAQRLSSVRGFARYRSSSDSRTQIQVPGLLPFKPKRARPYLYSSRLDIIPCRYHPTDDELMRFLQSI